MPSFKHALTARGDDNPDRQVSVSHWNAEHTVTGSAGNALVFDAAGDAAEIPVSLSASSRSAMSQLDISLGLSCHLREGARSGVFHPFTAADYATVTGRTLATDIGIDNTILDGFKGNVIIPVNSDYTGASGAWVYPYWSEDVSARLFGAVDGQDVKAAIEAWANFIWQVPCRSGSCRAVGITALPITVGYTSNSQTKLIHFGPTINATATMDAVVTLQHVSACHIDFSGCKIYGSSSTSTPIALSSRNGGTGLVITDAQYMTSSGKLFVGNCYHWGVVINDTIAINGNNSNFAQLPQISPNGCGVSKVTGGSSAMSANWSTPTRVGSSANTAQTTTINVSQIPRTDNVLGFGWYAWINGYPYRVSSSAASGDPTYPYTLTLGQPWLDDAMMTAGSGTLDYTMGGKVGIRGNDSGVIRIQGIGGSNSAISLFDNTAYGVICERLENNGGEDIWLAFGRGPNTFHYATKILSGYIEGTGALAHILSLSATASDRCTIGRVSGADFSFAKFFKHGPRSNVGGDNNLLCNQAMTELINLEGFEGKLIVAGYGCDFTTTWDPGNCASGTPVTTTLSIPAALSNGQSMRVKFGQILNGLILTGYVSNTSATTKTTVTLQLANPNSTTAQDLASSTATVTLLQ